MNSSTTGRTSLILCLNENKKGCRFKATCLNLRRTEILFPGKVKAVQAVLYFFAAHK